MSGDFGGPRQEPMAHQQTSRPAYPSAPGSWGVPPQDNPQPSSKKDAKVSRKMVVLPLLVAVVQAVLLVIFA